MKIIKILFLLVVGLSLVIGAGCREMADPGTTGNNYNVYRENDRIASREFNQTLHRYFVKERTRYPTYKGTAFTTGNVDTGPSEEATSTGGTNVR